MLINVRFDYIQYIIDYIYKGETNLLSSEIEGLLKLANDLQIQGLCGVLNKKMESISDSKLQSLFNKSESLKQINSSSDVQNLINNSIITGEGRIQNSSQVQKKRTVGNKEVSDNLLAKKRKVDKKQEEAKVCIFRTSY